MLRGAVKKKRDMKKDDAFLSPDVVVTGYDSRQCCNSWKMKRTHVEEGAKSTTDKQD